MPNMLFSILTTFFQKAMDKTNIGNIYTERENFLRTTCGKKERCKYIYLPRNTRTNLSPMKIKHTVYRKENEIYNYIFNEEF